MNICISCGMPLEEKTTSKLDEKYCIYCQNQNSGILATFEQVRKGGIDAAVRLMGKTPQEAEKLADDMLPQLPRWKNQILTPKK